MTGKTGQFHTRLCRDYGFGKECFVGGVNPKKAGQVWEGLPIFGSVKEAKEKTGANVSVIYVPPAGAAAAIQEASDAGIDLIVCITEGIPVMDMVKVRDHMKKTGSKSLLLGPNCPGHHDAGRSQRRHHACAHSPQRQNRCCLSLRHPDL